MASPLGVAEIRGWVRTAKGLEPFIKVTQKDQCRDEKVEIWKSDGAERSGDQLWFKRRR
jgi:hypothetical protein